MSHLNYFEPYRRPRYERHEDDLTRAFLVLLRMVPLVLAEFLERLRERQLGCGYAGHQILPRLSETEADVGFATQTSELDAEREWLVSVLMTDEKLPVDGELASRGQGARYDGVLTLGDHVVTIENKPHRQDVWENQLNPDLPEETTLRFPKGARPLVLPWREMILALTNLRNQERFDPTAAALVDDFLSYVFRYYEFLNPYPTLAACRESRLLLNRRCGQILEALGGEEHVHEHVSGRFYLKLPGTHVAVRRALLSAGPYGGGEVTYIGAAVYPGDLVSQAQPFYENVDRNRLVALIEDDSSWHARTNLHLSYRGDHLVYATREGDVGSYLDYWKEHGDRIRRVSGMEAMRDEVRRLEDDGWLAQEDVEQFEQKFGRTKREFVDVCPGLRVETRWSLREVRELDDGAGRFVDAVRRRFERVLGLWGQELVTPGHE